MYQGQNENTNDAHNRETTSWCMNDDMAIDTHVRKIHIDSFKCKTNTLPTIFPDQYYGLKT